MWFTKKKPVRKEYDKTTLEPVLRRSICTGETTAGFRDKKNGAFKEVMLITDDEDLRAFTETYGITEELKTIY
jgi:hypothetical protein